MSILGDLSNKMIIFVLCGIQGSGKTTLANILEKQYNAKRYSHDELIEADKQANGAVLKQQMHQMAVEELRKGNNVILDAMYTTKSQRQQILSVLADVQCEKVLFVMSTPYHECLRRNAKRTKPIPVGTIEWTRFLYQPPELSEGWDEIITV